MSITQTVQPAPIGQDRLATQPADLRSLLTGAVRERRHDLASKGTQTVTRHAADIENDVFDPNTLERSQLIGDIIRCSVEHAVFGIRAGMVVEEDMRSAGAIRVPRHGQGALLRCPMAAKCLLLV